jgi:hypothetical protein
VLRRAGELARLPGDLTDALGLLSDGRFPVAGAAAIAKAGSRAVDIRAAAGTRVVAARAGRVARTGTKHGRRYVVVRDAAGNATTYAALRAATHRRVVRAGDTVGVIGSLARVTVTIRPAGAHAPIDARPVLQTWRLLGVATGRRPSTAALFRAGNADTAGGRVFGLSAGALGRRVLGDPRIHIYPCGRRDIETGVIDRRVLAVLAYLAEAHLDPTVSSLRCGHSRLTTSGNVSEHSTGDAVDIAAINGVPVLGHQGPSSITETTIRRVLTLPSAFQPHQIISLMTFAGAVNTMSLGDHANHIHIGFRPSPLGGVTLDRSSARLSAAQWRLLLAQVG